MFAADEMALFADLPAIDILFLAVGIANSPRHRLRLLS
jgi:hypothetical protein